MTTTYKKYVPRTASPDVDEATERFTRAQWRYIQSPESLPKGKSYNLENTHNWNEVIDIAKDVASKFGHKGRRIQRLLHKGGVALGNAGDLTTPWIQLLPVGDYSAVISGGIKLIFTACIHMNDVRTAVMDALENLPDSLQTPEQYLDLYRTDEDLLRAVELLYIALLKALESMLIWLEHKTSVHVMKAFLLQGSYEKNTMSRISAIQPISDKVSAQIEFCFHARVKDIYQNTAQLMQQAPLMLKKAESTEEHLDELLSRLNACTELLFVLSEHKKLAEWRQQDEERRESEEHRRAAEQHQQATQQALLMVQEKLSHSSTPINVNVVQYVALPATPTIAPSQLFAILQPNLGSHNLNSEQVLSDGSKLQSIETRRGTWLMRQPFFQKWFNSDQSCVLLVDGQERDRPITSLSYLIAVLGQGLHNDPECTVLSHFCGLHADPSSFSISTPENINEASDVTKPRCASSIMRSLLGQLLVKTRLSFDTSRIDSNLIYWCEKGDLNALCTLFHILITNCVPSTFFILIDGISWLETLPQDEIEEAQRMFAEFRKLVNELSSIKSYMHAQGRKISNVKILLTSPRPSMEFQPYFNEDDLVSMPVAPAIGRGRFSGDHVMAEREAMDRDG